jgi:hypothetical protein
VEAVDHEFHYTSDDNRTIANRLQTRSISTTANQVGEVRIANNWLQRNETPAEKEHQWNQTSIALRQSLQKGTSHNYDLYRPPSSESSAARKMDLNRQITTSQHSHQRVWMLISKPKYLGTSIEVVKKSKQHARTYTGAHLRRACSPHRAYIL